MKEGPVEDERVKVWVIRDVGARPRMEDSDIVATGLPGERSLLAVFDGHGGAGAARFCSRYLLKYLQLDEAYAKGDFAGGLHRVFMQMDRLLRGSTQVVCSLQEGPEEVDENMIKEDHGVGEPPSYYWGTTATVALVLEGRVIVANAGDSYCCLVRDGKLLDLTVDHNVEVPAELERVQRAGCETNGRYVYRPGSVCEINMTRTLGDFGFKLNPSLGPELQAVSPVPDIVEVQLTKGDQYLLLSTDGVSRHSLGQIWPSILHSCNTNCGWWTLLPFLWDNETLLIAKLKRAAAHQPTPVRRFSWFTENKVKGFKEEVLGWSRNRSRSRSRSLLHRRCHHFQHHRLHSFLRCRKCLRRSCRLKRSKRLAALTCPR